MIRSSWSRHGPVLATALVCAALYTAAALRYRSFASVAVLIQFFSENADLGITAIGMTFVILSGGIDLSVGSVVGFTSILVAVLVERQHWPAGLVLTLALAAGAVFGAAMGGIIQAFGLAPFLVTLAGMFLVRGLGQLISLESVEVRDRFFDVIGGFGLSIGRYWIALPAIVFASVAIAGASMAKYTRFGRNVYAIGGSESSALLMGLPVGRTKIGIYALSGLCAAMAGVVNALYKHSGYSSTGVGLELDAIAAVVIGGTLLSGGIGSIGGTVLGVVILAIIQTAILFEGTLSSWWTKIVVGGLLLAFIAIQKLLIRRT
jgi:ribose/xylose/arabinose/galactoside ABC-type transport system permease subunit